MARVAVFATHGMGQQTKIRWPRSRKVFDARLPCRLTLIKDVKAARSSTVNLGTRFTQRLRVDIGGTEVDVFEAYGPRGCIGRK